MTLVTATIALQAGPEHLIKQRAKDVANQNNERQGATPAQPSSPPAAQPTQPAVVAPPAQPPGPPLSSRAASIRDALANLQKAAGATDEQRAQLEKSLSAAANGKIRPSQALLAKLASDLAKALPGNNMNANGHAWLATQLESMVRGTVTAKDMETASAAVHDFLRDAGAGRVEAAVVRNDLKAVIVELNQATAK